MAAAPLKGLPENGNSGLKTRLKEPQMMTSRYRITTQILSSISWSSSKVIRVIKSLSLAPSPLSAPQDCSSPRRLFKLEAKLPHALPWWLNFKKTRAAKTVKPRRKDMKIFMGTQPASAQKPCIKTTWEPRLQIDLAIIGTTPRS